MVKHLIGLVDRKYEKSTTLKGEIKLSKPKYIKDWEELKEEASPTHILEIEMGDCNGWIRPKNGDEESWEGNHYLSTHTFYGGCNEGSTKLLQSCGFNVILANWDEIGY